MKRKGKKISGIVFYVLIGAGVLLSLIAPRISPLIEAGYSRSMYIWIVRPLSLLTGLLPFSLTEFTVVALVLFCLVKIALTVGKAVKKPKVFFRSLLKGIPKLALALVLMYVAFNMLWGLNYSRFSFAQISGLEIGPSSVNELKLLAEALTEQANSLREQVQEDDRGVMTLPQGVREMLGRADLGYQKAAKINPELGGKYGRPKGVLLSRYWSYTGIGGVYFPFTAEANVNIDMPHFMLPSAATHEMAHQRGFAREDEANYISYLTCKLHPDLDFQYSGTMLALQNTMNALARHNLEAYKEVRARYSEGVNRDWQDWQEYWQRYEGPVEKASNRVNDSFLKVNRQQDGVYSYGRMVDLLLADFRQRGNLP